MAYGEYNVKALLDGLAGSVKELTDPHRVVFQHPIPVARHGHLRAGHWFVVLVY